jgi:hypothetical protein
MPVCQAEERLSVAGSGLVAPLLRQFVLVDEEVLATLVKSDADDYRYASRNGFDLELVTTALPTSIANLVEQRLVAWNCAWRGVIFDGP